MTCWPPAKPVMNPPSDRQNQPEGRESAGNIDAVPFRHRVPVPSRCSETVTGTRIVFQTSAVFESRLVSEHEASRRLLFLVFLSPLYYRHALP